MNKLKGYLAMAGYTQTDIAKWIGVSRTVVNICISREAFKESEKTIIFEKLKEKIPNISIQDLWK